MLMHELRRLSLSQSSVVGFLFLLVATFVFFFVPLLGGTLFTAVCGRILFLNWPAWERFVHLHGPSTDSIGAESSDAMAAAILVLAVVFMVSTIFFAASMRRK